MTRLFFLFLGVGVGLAVIGAIVTRKKPQIVSAQWLKDQERVDLIQHGQWDGVVRWPWGSDSDEAA